MMKNKYIRALLVDYGMVFVLIALCLLISLLTISDKHPEDVSAARKLAASLLKEVGSDIRVLVVARKTEADEVFAQVLKEGLESGGADVVGVELGDPSSLRKRLELLGQQDERVDFIATHDFSSKWRVLSQTSRSEMASLYPGLSSLKIAKPASYRWPTFLTINNLIGILNQNAPIAIMAIGMTLVIITAGIDLSVGSLMALAAVVTATTIRSYLGNENASAFGVGLAFLVGMSVCALAGVFAGVIVTLFKVPPFVVTLGLMMVARGMSYILAGGADAVKIEADSIGALYSSSVFGIPSQIVLMMVLFVVAHIVMNHTAFGRYVYAVGGNETAARLSGVPVVGVLIVVYAICGLAAGLAGVLDVSHFG
ncbi:MAG: ABC transporter permease, partial [Planctomycetaceae bacterium]|nr:ABC transporter permease [Planctomycetaceae bacterium]